MKEIRLVLADDHQIVIDGIKLLIEDQEDIKLVGEANNGQQVLRLLESLHVDVVLMDLDMPVMNGLEATKELRVKYPRARVLILTMHNEKALINKLVEIGASGFLLKNSSQEELLEGIRKVAAGQTYFSSDVTMTLLGKEPAPSAFSPGSVTDLSHLTERETEIIKLVAEGYSNKEIGEKLFISHRTVDTHRTNLMKKLGVHNIAGLIKIAIKSGLVQ